MHMIDAPGTIQIARSLGDDEVHVWRLDTYRRELGRSPLLRLLGAYLELSHDDILLVEGEHGRPELSAPHDRNIAFNWSHSGTTALVAIARNIVPGIDVEQLRPRPRAMALAERYFHASEIAALLALDEALRERAFLQLWTGKEAVLKALGRGLAFGLQRLRISVLPAEAQLLWLDDEDVNAWQLHTLPLDESAVGSLAWRGSPHTVHIRTLADDG